MKTLNKPILTCRRCFGQNTIEYFKKEKGIVKRGICLKCYSLEELTRIIISRAESEPHLYFNCNDCDRIFKKNIQGRYPKVRTNCYYCKSENIEPY